ncbi:MAG: hypothetical protein HY735_28945 [Verrucomicrobia bacterium]|nr:hypothetical protein [Verrucomicrobiota bacterium]
MNTKSWLALALALGLSGCGKKEGATTTAKSTNQTNASGNPLTAPVDYLGAVGQAKKLAVKTVDLATLNQAIQLFRTGEDRFPKDLNELVSEGYLPRLPAPPPGTRLEYNPVRGQVRVVKQ